MNNKLGDLAGRLLLAHLLVFSQGVWGREQPKTDDNAKPAQKAPVQHPGERPSITNADKEQADDSEIKSSGDGRHEGIRVHGHWTIEVRNPNGDLVTHREFENAIIFAGSALLANLLQGVYVPAGWILHVGGTNAAQTPSNQANPCGPAALTNNPNSIIVNAGNARPNFCELAESLASSAVGNGYCNANPPTAFCTLIRTPPVGNVVNANPGQIAISLSGVFVAPNNGFIGSVASDDEICSSNPGNHVNQVYQPFLQAPVTRVMANCLAQTS